MVSEYYERNEQKLSIDSSFDFTLFSFLYIVNFPYCSVVYLKYLRINHIYCIMVYEDISFGISINNH